MRKGIKILGKVLSATILLLVILPLLLSLLLSINAVQNAVVDSAAGWASRKLETTVSIDRVDIGLLGKVKLSGFYVEDYQKDTLLYVGQLDAYVTGLGIFGGGVVLNRAKAVDARLCLHETPDGDMNIKQIVDRLSNPDKPKTGNFKLTLRKVALENMTFCLEKLEHREPEFGIDFGHMHVYGMTGFVDDLTIDGTAIYTTIQALRARERSGFVLDHLAGRFYLNNGCLGFDEAYLATEKSSIRIPYISIVGNSWGDFKDFIGEVSIDGKLRNTTVSSDDIAYFAPKLRGWNTVFSNIDAEVSGTVADFTGKIRSMKIGDGTRLTATAAIKGLPDIDNTHFDLDIPHLTSSAAEIDRLASGIGGKELSKKLVEILGNSGDIDLSARFKGMLSSFDMQSGVKTDAGHISCNLKIKPVKDGLQSIRGDVVTRDLKLGKLLGQTELLGNATLEARVDGVIGRGYADANVEGDITRLELKGYTYDSIRLDGRIRNKRFDGLVTARDPSLDFDFSGMVDLNDSIPGYDFSMELRHADLVKTNINRRDSVSTLSAHISANARGRSLDDLNGRIDITDAVYHYNDKVVTTANMTVVGENSESNKFIDLRSDFADATFRSKTSYRIVFEYLRQSAWKYFPLLTAADGRVSSGEKKEAVVDDYSLLSVSIRNFNPVADAVSPGLQIADGSSMQLLFNPASNRLSLKASSEYVERDRLLATRLNVNASNRGDSLLIYASAEDLYAGVLHMPQFSVTGGAKQGRVQFTAGFNDTTRVVSALLGVRAEIAEENGPAGRVVDLRILPSHLSRGDKTWQVMARKIQVDTARIAIERFRVMNNEQELLIEGVASRNRDDSVTLRLRNFDIAPLSQVVERMGYAVDGRTNGSATMKSVMRGGEMRADITFDSVTVNDIEAPPTRLVARWDFARNRAGVTLTNRIKQDTLVRGFYNPSQVRYYARINIDSLDMGLLDPILTNVISDTRGVASAELTLQGERRNADLTGQIRVSGMATTVDYTRVTYSMPSAVMEVKNNRFKAADVPVYDPLGNKGRFDIDLSLNHLSNISYDVRVAPQKMLVLNTTSADNDFFYGRVFATGRARISGDKGSVKMDISATSDDNSSFFMPMSSKSNIAYADFVTFVEPVKIDTTDNVALKKMLFENRRKQKSSAVSDMDITLALDVKPNVEVELTVADNAIKARGEGLLNLHINPRKNLFEMFGDYTISEGNYLFTLQNVISKRFTIDGGSSIQWTGGPMDAMLDIDAVYKLKASLQPLLQSSNSTQSGDRSVPVECVIHLGDRLSKPSVDLDVRIPATDSETHTLIANALTTPEQVDTQFAYLLLFNSFMSENNASNMGASVASSTGFEFISNMLSNMLSSNDYKIVISYRPKSDLTSDEVDFGLSKSLIDNRLLVEVEGNYILDNRQAVNSSMSNFMGEAYITYLIDRSGSLKLKAFTQTIDRFDENQGMQETGVGVYYKEDFNNFKDFRQRVKERFSNKQRQVRREEKAAAKAAEKEAEAQQAAAKAAEEEKKRAGADTLSGAAIVNDEEDNL